MTKDMTVGNPAKTILYFSIPILIGNIFQQLYSMVDTIIVGKFINSQALAAVGSTGCLYFLIIGFVQGITSGLAIVTSQCFGAKDDDALRNSVTTSILIGSIITVILTILSVVTAKPLLQLMNTPKDIIHDAYIYIVIIYLGIGCTMLYNMVSCILRALGDSKTPLYFLALSSVMNIILDILFITTFHLGVAGAAYATVISQGVSGILCFFYMKKHYSILKLKKKDWKMNGSFVRKHLAISFPMAFQFSITAIGTIVLQGALNLFGSVKIASFTAASKVEQLAMQPAMTFGITMATYAGQNLGANRYDRIKQGIRQTALISLGISVCVIIFLITMGDNITCLFLDKYNYEIVTSSQYYLNVVAFFFPPLHLLFIYRNALQGMAKSFTALMAGVIELLARCSVALLLPSVLGYTAICLAGPAAWVAAGLYLVISYLIIIRKMERKQN